MAPNWFQVGENEAKMGKIKRKQLKSKHFQKPCKNLDFCKVRGSWEGPSWAQDIRSWAQEGPSWAQDGPRSGQDGQGEQKMAEDAEDELEDAAQDRQDAVSDRLPRPR